MIARRRSSVDVVTRPQGFVPAARPEPHPAAVIALRDVDKTYRTGEIEVRALRGVSVTIDRGEYVAIMGCVGQRQEHADEHPRMP